MSSPKSVKLGVAVKLMPPDVAPMMSDFATSPLVGVKLFARMPAFIWMCLNMSCGSWLYFIRTPLIGSQEFH